MLSALMVESRQTLKTWKEQAQQYLIEGRFQDYHSVLEKISFVLDLRRQLAAKQVENDEVRIGM
jgi:transposase-like protein